MRSRRENAMDPPPKTIAQVRCNSCGWKGESEALVETKDETLDAIQKGYYSIGTPLKAVTYRDLDCPRCGTKLGEVEYLGGAETGRTDVSSSGAKDVTCPKCGWYGKDVQLIRYIGETDPSDSMFRYLYREEGVGQVKFPCPECHEPLKRDLELYGRDIG